MGPAASDGSRFDAISCQCLICILEIAPDHPDLEVGLLKYHAYFAGLPGSRHRATRSETFASPTHMTVSAPPPIDLHGSIRLRNGTTGKDHVVDISGDFTGIFRLQNPRVAHADDLCRVQQVVQSNPQTIDRSIHRSENSVIDGKPSLVRFDRRRTGTDLHFIPVI